MDSHGPRFALSGPGVNSVDDLFESTQVVVPSIDVVTDRVVGKSSVSQAQQRLLALRRQRDLNLGGARGNRMTGKVPPEREDDLLVGDNFDELSSTRIDAAAKNSELTAGNWIHGGLGPHPLHEPVRINEVRKDFFG